MSNPIGDALRKRTLVEDETLVRAKRRVGRMIRDRWHVDSLIGLGGMAAVYAATHRNGKRVALKVLHAELSANEDARRRFLDEGYASNRIDHPAAESVLDDGVSEDGEAFLVMELFAGKTLETELLTRERLTEGEVLVIADTVLDVLALAHDRGIIHRDVKPDNVFLVADGEVKLLDFGIARVCEPGRTRHTETGTPLGTPAFMPPEQAFGRWDQIDGRTDLWSVGATMFTALTGHRVHQGRTDNEELLSAMTRRAPSIRTVAPDVSPDVAHVVDRALAFEKEARWPDARAMQSAVRAVARSHRFRAEHVPSVALTMRIGTSLRKGAPRSHQGRNWLGVAVLSIAVGAGVTAVARSSEVVDAWSQARNRSGHLDLPKEAVLSAPLEVSIAPATERDNRLVGTEDLQADLAPSDASAVSSPNVRATAPDNGSRTVKRTGAPRPNRLPRPNMVAPTAAHLSDPIYDDPPPPPPELRLPNPIATGDPLRRRH